MSFIAGIVVSYTLGILIFKAGNTSILYGLSRFFGFFSSFTPSPTFLSDIAAFEGILIGVAIPISLQVVNWTVDRYKDHEIAQFFIKESLYRAQYFLLLPNIAIAIFLRFLDTCYLIVLWLIFLWLIVNMVIFYRFVRLVEQYTTNTDRLLLGKLKKHAEAILRE